ncbi:MAG: sulfurtransferase TusA family protein [Aquificaceae bacterium]|nr:sulfurtransferase TusA family protein [Aquificaceae bacterium]MCS7307244.1 sulfurtransferase TusA family protein [Aquificaceae bacterium]MDW8434400.1 sulfurtransferase TusA family protein [Aquificaceae bacterium]
MSVETKKAEDLKQEFLDLTGLMCPLPIVITSEKMRKLSEGQLLKVLATDPGFERDVHNWCSQTGNELVSVKKEGDKVIAVLRKRSETREPSLWYWIKFHSLGVKLHLRHYLMLLNPFVEKPDHFITFVAISEGTRAEKHLKGKAKLIPIPDEIDKRCGVVMAVHGYQKAMDIYDQLRKDGFGVEAIYKKEGKTYRRVYP